MAITAKYSKSDASNPAPAASPAPTASPAVAAPSPSTAAAGGHAYLSHFQPTIPGELDAPIARFRLIGCGYYAIHRCSGQVCGKADSRFSRKRSCSPWPTGMAGRCFCRCTRRSSRAAASLRSRFSNICSSRPASLSSLSDGAIADTGLKAWKKLRNAAAHGDWSSRRSNYQEWIEQIGAVRTLFHQLIFRLIGYTGTYTDYGTRGYLLGRYPPGNTAGVSPSSDGAG